MKTLNKKSIITTLLITFFATSLFAQLKVRNDAAIQIGYEKYRYLSFGIEQNSPNNGKYAIEHFGEEEKMSGLNFWKPWPTPKYTNYVLFLRDDHNIGMSTIGSTKFRLDVNGHTRSWSYSTYSDERLKSNIVNIESPLDKLLKLRGVTYTYNPKIESTEKLNTDGLEETKINTFKQDDIEDVSHKSIGFIAQEVKEVLPEVITEDENGYLSMNYDAVVPLLVESIKEQQTTINDLKDKISAIESNCYSANFKKGQSEESQSFKSSKLFNNSPNPFSAETKIDYYLNFEENQNTKALISIYDLNGRLVDSFLLDNKNGKGTITISDESLKAGSYVYSLSINEEVIDSKIMIKIAH